MALQSVADFVGLIFFWTRWLSVLYNYVRKFIAGSYIDNVFTNRLIATLKCESMVTPRPFDPVMGYSTACQIIFLS